jgi:hypothetical protein
MKWVYIIGGILLFLLMNRLMAEYSHKSNIEEVEILHSGAQP